MESIALGLLSPPIYGSLPDSAVVRKIPTDVDLLHEAMEAMTYDPARGRSFARP